MIDEIFIQELNSLGALAEYNLKQYKLCNGSTKTIEQYRVFSSNGVDKIATLTITEYEKNAEIFGDIAVLSLPQAVKILQAIERKLEND